MTDPGVLTGFGPPIEDDSALATLDAVVQAGEVEAGFSQPGGLKLIVRLVFASRPMSMLNVDLVMLVVWQFSVTRCLDYMFNN